MLSLLISVLFAGTSLAATACAPQSTGSGPTPTPDTAPAFYSDPTLQSIAAQGQGATGYSQSFANLTGAINGPNYLTVTTLRQYRAAWCATKCDTTSGCAAFNLYEQRAPSVQPGPSCPDPPSVTYYRCGLWGSPVAGNQATNKGQTREKFQIVIAGSAGYNRDTTLPPGTGLTGPWRFTTTGNATVNYAAKKYLNYTVGPDPSGVGPGASVISYFPDLDPFYQHYFYSNSFKPSGVQQCDIILNGQSVSPPGVTQVGISCTMPADYHLTLEARCPPGAQGVIQFDDQFISRAQGGYYITDTVI